MLIKLLYFRLDNNTLLYLMLDVFDNSEEQFVKVCHFIIIKMIIK